MNRKFCIVTKDMSGLGFALDPRNANDDIIIATNPDIECLDKKDQLDAFNEIGSGMMGKQKWVFELSDVMKNRAKMKDWYFIFDGNHSVTENELLRKEGFMVGLGGELPYKMENDREFGIELAEKLGIESPLWEEFNTAEEGIKFLKENPNDAFFFKPNASDESHLTTPPTGRNPKRSNELLQEYLPEIEMKEGYILQKKVRGTEVNLEYFCVDGVAVSAQINLEVKRISEASLIDGYEKGSLCGCSIDVCKSISLDNKLVKETIGKLLPFIKENEYTGFADMNFIIGDNNHWFIEWCFRTGYNAHPNYFMNVSNKSCLHTVADMVDGTYKPDIKRGWGASVTMYTDHPGAGSPISIPEDMKARTHLFDGKMGKKCVVQSGISNDIVIVGGYGDTIQEAISDAYDGVAKIQVIKSDYRSDGLRDDCNSSPIRRYRALQQLGYL